VRGAQDLRARKALAPTGMPARILHPGGLSNSGSMTLLISAAKPHFYWEYRSDSNTQVDFVNFLAKSVACGFLSRGDILVLDNASVHVGMEYFEALVELMTLSEIRVVSLPTYSPELNPCELVFGKVKASLRSDDAQDSTFSRLPLPIKIAIALSIIPQNTLLDWYLKCMQPAQI
jgi:hypothetical protein